ncbi:hypothetical protein AAEO50_04000 [Rossellomorea oryzaecorticis]|uniref:Uncharacterized protein n=1 Tax=Rossellomorea oryzaecorticis TaxID=1396505 RepID=A0ABU9K881_9BACI
MRRKLIAAVIITSSFLTTAVIANSIAFNHAKQSCVENQKTTRAEKEFLAFNWSVSCR